MFDGSGFLELVDPGTRFGTSKNDNLLYSPPSPTLLDGSGLAFTSFKPGLFQIFFNESGEGFCGRGYSVFDGFTASVSCGGSFTATAVPSPAPIPEPASLGIVAVGFACLAAFFSRRWMFTPPCGCSPHHKANG